MKVLFLDCDGVLNSHAYFNSNPSGSYGGQLKLETWDETDDRCWAAMLDPVAVDRLMRIVEETDCKIVMSTTWRKHLTPERFKVAFGMAGFKDAPIIGITGDHSHVRGMYGFRGERGHEIREWLDTHGANVTAYAVVDDDSDMDRVDPEKFVQTSWPEGMLDEHAARLVEILNGE